MAKRRNYSRYDFFGYEYTHPIEVKGGLKARSQRGEFAKNWWATQWIAALERLVDAGRLSRGRSYARKGQVLSIEEVKGGIEARVQGSQPKPYKVTIKLSSLTDAQWEKVIGLLSEQAIYTAQLLAGEMPSDIDDVFRLAGVSLLPQRSGDLSTNCSCPDYANPCKHVAAVHYILGERFDEDPFMLFRLRGRSQEQVLDGLRRRRAGQEFMEAVEEDETENFPSLEECLPNFWSSGCSLDDFSVSIQAPPIDLPLLRRLGDPGFVQSPGLQALLRPVYTAISTSALKVAFQEAEEEKNDPD